MNPLQTRTENAIKEGDLDLAFDILFKNTAPDHAVRTDIIHAKSNYAELKEKFGSNLIAFKDFNEGCARVKYHLLENLLPRLNDDDDTPLFQTVKSLGVDPDNEIGILQRVNCDRRAASRQFWTDFDARKTQKQHFQFYFIAGCPDEMPNTFAERLIYELMEQELAPDGKKIDYVFTEERGGNKNAGNNLFKGPVELEDLPLGPNAERSKRLFKAYVQNRFKFADTQNFEAFIDTGVPKLPFDYIVGAYRIFEDAWEAGDNNLREYLQWMVDTFRCPHADVPTFVFFIVVEVRRLYETAQPGSLQKFILDELKKLCSRNESTLLTELPPPPESDLSTWLRKLGTRNPNQASQVIAALAKSLKGEEKELYEAQQKFHMKDIDTVQEMVYQLAKK